jgi:hypothetical protein
MALAIGNSRPGGIAAGGLSGSKRRVALKRYAVLPVGHGKLAPRLRFGRCDRKPNRLLGPAAPGGPAGVDEIGRAMATSETAADKAKVTGILYAAIDELNKELGELGNLEKSPSTIISGEGSSLDSLAIVSLGMILEEKVAAAFGADIFIDFDQFVDAAGTEARTVDDLCDHILELVKQSATAP